MQPDQWLGRVAVGACPIDQAFTGTATAVQPFAQFGREWGSEIQQRASELNPGVVYVLVERHEGNV